MLRLAFLFIILTSLSCAPSRIIKDKAYRPYSKDKGIYYLVKSGDSLWQISRTYNLSVERLMRENNISSPYNLKVGQKIFIPRYTSSRAASFLWPLKGEIVNYFNESVNNTRNRGLNIQVTADNRKIKASAEGRVVFANDLKGWGKTIILKHDSSLYTIYANLDNSLVKEGAPAKRGDAIGVVASDKDGSYILHFEVRKRYIPEDPLRYLN